MANPQRNLITFVCTGNICRSPMAEKLLAHALKAEPEPLRSLEVISAGVYASDGVEASPNAVDAVKKVGLDLSHHQSRLLTQEIIDRSFAIFTMTESHRDAIKTRFSPLPQYLYLMREFLPDSHEVGIPDPYGSEFDTYEACRDTILEAIPSLLHFLRNYYAPHFKISIGADHAGAALRESLIKILNDKHCPHQVIDHGAKSQDESVDYPDFSHSVAKDVTEGRADYGILICKTGIGMSISANKLRGIRAALVHNEEDAYFARAHNNANILCLGSIHADAHQATELLNRFLTTPFQGGRHQRRIDKITVQETNATGRILTSEN